MASAIRALQLVVGELARHGTVADVTGVTRESSLETTVPKGSPVRSFARVPGVNRSNTIIGNSFSMHSESAVASMTCSLRFKASIYFKC